MVRINSFFNYGEYIFSVYAYLSFFHENLFKLLYLIGCLLHYQVPVGVFTEHFHEKSLMFMFLIINKLSKINLNTLKIKSSLLYPLNFIAIIFFHNLFSFLRIFTGIYFKNCYYTQIMKFLLFIYSFRKIFFVVIKNKYFFI